jgi:hypothetical protein
MFHAVTPATWMLSNEETAGGESGRPVRTTHRVALAVLLLTGLYQCCSSYRSHPSGPQGTARRSSPKMGAFTTIIVLIVLHVFLFARKIARLSDAVIAGDEEQRPALETARSQSFLFSLILLIVTMGTLALGVALGDESFSYAQR